MLTKPQLKALKDCVAADDLLVDTADCWAYGYDNSRQQACPDAVVFARGAEQLQAVVQFCNHYRVPLIPRGLGTGTTGATVPAEGGLVVSYERMNRIISIVPDDRLVIVEPGVTNQALQTAVAEHGFFWPPDPTSAAYSTIGGNLAYNSAGPRAVKYGTPRENTLGLQAITGAGESIQTGVRTTKGVVGYDLTRLLIGSEGTLALFTQATLKLTPLSEGRRTLRAVYADMSSAAHAVAAIMAQPVIPRSLEFIDGMAIEMIRAYSEASLPEAAGAMLMIEVDGARDCLETAAQTLRRVAATAGCLEVTVARNEAEVKALWATRKALSPALRNVAPKKINEDIVVPVSRMPELIRGLRELSERYGVTIVNFGHAGNGNIHVNMLVDPDDEQQMAAAGPCLDEVFALVLRLDGSLSGEHGIGLVKRDFIAREIAPATLALMRRIKRQFDPNGILNPGKLFPPA